jgi:hypothetical protein
MFNGTQQAQAKLGTQVAKVIEAMRAAASDTRYTEQARRDAARAAYEQGLPGIRAAREAEVVARQADLADVETKVKSGYARSGPPKHEVVGYNPDDPHNNAALSKIIIHELRTLNARQRLTGASTAELRQELEQAAETNDRAAELAVRDLARAAARKDGGNWQEPGGSVRPGDWPVIDWQDRHIGRHATQFADPELPRIIGRLAELEHARFLPSEREALEVQSAGKTPRLTDLTGLARLAESAGVRYADGADTLAELVRAPGPE